MSWTFYFRDVQKLNNEFIFEFLVLLFIKNSICTICTYSDFFLVCKLCLLFRTILDLWPVLILEIFSSLDIKKGQFQFLVPFEAVFFWSVNCTSCLYIRSVYHHIYWTWVMFYLRVFSIHFLVFSVFKYLKFTLSSNFSWSGNVEVLICKLYMPGL